MINSCLYIVENKRTPWSKQICMQLTNIPISVSRTIVYVIIFRLRVRFTHRANHLYHVSITSLPASSNNTSKLLNCLLSIVSHLSIKEPRLLNLLFLN